VAVTVTRFLPICNPTVATVQARVPEAVPLPPQSAFHVTRVTLSVAVPSSGTVLADVVQRAGQVLVDPQRSLVGGEDDAVGVRQPRQRD